MSKNKLAFCALAACVLWLTACTQKAIEKDVDQKVTQETSINTQADLNAESANLIETATNITEEQRDQLLVLREKTRAETQEQNKESLRLRSVLVKEMLASNYNGKEVSAIKRKIKKADNKMLSILTDSIQKTNTILGRQARDNRAEHNYDFIIHDFNFEQRNQ